MKQKRVQEFVVPRGRVPTEVSRAFQSILISLRNLEEGIDASPEDSGELDSIRAQLQELERSTVRREPEQVRVVREHRMEISYSSTFGDT